MRLTYPICCGLDVHKNVIVATIASTDKSGISTYQQKTFSTINSDIQKFHSWLIVNQCYHVCMEPTGKYWIPIFDYLESDIDICLTHPKYVKAIKGKILTKKTPNGLLIFISLPCKKLLYSSKRFQRAKGNRRYRFKLVCMKSSEKNRIQNCMTVSNIGIASILSDPFEKTATEIISYLLSNTADTFDEKACSKLIKKGAKSILQVYISIP